MDKTNADPIASMVKGFEIGDELQKSPVSHWQAPAP